LIKSQLLYQLSYRGKNGGGSELYAAQMRQQGFVFSQSEAKGQDFSGTFQERSLHSWQNQSR
jgi:hypothetical protein